MSISDFELLDELAAALEPPTPVTPTPEALQRLHATLASLSTPEIPKPQRWKVCARMSRRATMLCVTFSLISTGVAAAGVSTDTLPGPTRNIAYDLGLPVTSPALFQTRNTLSQLRSSIAASDHAQIQRNAPQLYRDLRGLDAEDLASIRANAYHLLNANDLPIPPNVKPPTPPGNPPATTPTGPSAGSNNAPSGPPVPAGPNASPSSAPTPSTQPLNSNPVGGSTPSAPGGQPPRNTTDPSAQSSTTTPTKNPSGPPTSQGPSTRPSSPPPHPGPTPPSPGSSQAGSTTPPPFPHPPTGH